jgi:predicted GNAT family acetyltransferase
MSWYKKAQNSPELQNIIDKWTNQGITLFVYERDDKITLDSLIIPKEIRKQGIGTQIMQELINYADSVNKRIELSPGQKDPYHGTTSQNRLIDFYKRFNFLRNKGRNKDYSTTHTMYRDPK